MNVDDRASGRHHPLLEVKNLRVAFGPKRVVDGLSFSVEKGRTLGIIGESGSGKSMTALSIMHLADTIGASYPSGSILFDRPDGQVDLLGLSQREMRDVRGKNIAMVFQEPMTSLDPTFTVGDQIAEAIMLHKGESKAEALSEAERLLEMVMLPEPRLMLKRHAHQLSGGMRQRVMIAMALSCHPRLLIADEPTTALDVTIQAQILSIIKELQKELDMTVIFITHDMGVVAEIADDVVVMRSGKKVEEGSVGDIFTRASAPYTKALLASVPRLGSMKDSSLPRPFSVPDPDAPDRPPSEPPIHDTARYTKPLVSVSNLVVGFDVRKDFFGRTTQRLHAVEKVSFDIYPGETLALVGESGSGKSTIGRTIQQLQVASSGDFSFEGRSFSSMAAEERRRLQRRIQYIFQDPFASLDPRKTVGFSIAEPIRTHRIIEDKEAIRERVAELLERVGLEAKSSSCYPHEFSGGQRQRICIARALASEPSLIVADEALTAMDVSIQAQIVNLFMELQRERRLSYLFISHDMAVMERISHRVAVLYLGQIVELGSRAQVFGNPLHPYTKSLLAAVPVPDPSRRVERPFMEREMSTSVFRVGEKPRHVRLEERERGHFVGIED